MRFHKRLRHCSLQALPWFPPHYDISVRYVATPCIYIYTVIYQSKCIYIPSDICISKLCGTDIYHDMSPAPPCCMPHHHLRCVKEKCDLLKNLYPVREVRLEVIPCCKICPKTGPPKNTALFPGPVRKKTEKNICSRVWKTFISIIVYKFY